MAEIEEGVTVVVTRRVKPGREEDYEAWLARLTKEVKKMPGYLGISVQRPPPDGPREYNCVYRFDGVASLRAFEDSEARRRALAEVGAFVEADATWRKLTGLELWFTAPPGTVAPQPSRLRMAVIMVAVVYGLVLVLGPLVALAVPNAPLAFRMFVTITIEVFLMTYLVMPRVTRWLARWIYP
jgi:antibiotic biosynthesis monooxygenase (ABM) superfamily enzyme